MLHLGYMSEVRAQYSKNTVDYGEIFIIFGKFRTKVLYFMRFLPIIAERFHYCRIQLDYFDIVCY